MCLDRGIKLQEIGGLDLWSGAAAGDGASQITKLTCGFYRRGINGDKQRGFHAACKHRDFLPDTGAVTWQHLLSTLIPKTYEITELHFRYESRIYRAVSVSSVSV